MRRILPALLTVLLLFGARAASAANDAAGFVQQLGNQAITSLTGPGVSAAERRERFRALFVQSFDVSRLARFSLGPYWRQATPAQQADYTRLFEVYVVQIYANRFTEYSGQTLRVTGQRASDDGTLVTSDVAAPGQQPTKVNWRVEGSAPNFKITDVQVAGVSMTITQRDEFSSVIQRGGGNVEALIAELRQKTGAS